MTTRQDIQRRRCGRRSTHRAHTWITAPDADIDFRCDGKSGARPAVQLVVEHPALRSVRGAGVVLAEAAVSA